MIKKLLSLALVLTLMASLTFANTANAIDPQYETIKIGINYGSSGKSLVGISSPNGFKVGYMNGSQFVHLYDMTETYLDVAYASATTIKINGSTYDISNGNYAFSPNSGSVNIAGTLYRGGVEFLPNSSGLLNVINFVNINDYIAAVVGKEMSPSWNIEALKAQAVCARTFSLYNWNKHSSHGFNLCGTQDCQAYLGVSGESESTVRAANETLNQVITYNGKVILLFIHLQTAAQVLIQNTCGEETCRICRRLTIYTKIRRKPPTRRGRLLLPMLTFMQSSQKRV